MKTKTLKNAIVFWSTCKFKVTRNFCSVTNNINRYCGPEKKLYRFVEPAKVSFQGSAKGTFKNMAVARIVMIGFTPSSFSSPFSVVRPTQIFALRNAAKKVNLTQSYIFSLLMWKMDSFAQTDFSFNLNYRENVSSSHKTGLPPV